MHVWPIIIVLVVAGLVASYLIYRKDKKAKDAVPQKPTTPYPVTPIAPPVSRTPPADDKNQPKVQ